MGAKVGLDSSCVLCQLIGEEEDVSVYDIADHPDFRFRTTDFVIRIGNAEDGASIGENEASCVCTGQARDIIMLHEKMRQERDGGGEGSSVARYCCTSCLLIWTEKHRGILASFWSCP